MFIQLVGCTPLCSIDMAAVAKIPACDFVQAVFYINDCYIAPFLCQLWLALQNSH